MTADRRCVSTGEAYSMDRVCLFKGGDSEMGIGCDSDMTMVN